MALTPKKLRPFILQLELNFHDRPKNYLDNENKVNFVLSYLKGAALDYFEPEITEPRALPPDWLFDYDTFKEELRSNFGPYDPMEDAESELTELRMRSSQRLTEYIVQFFQVAHQVHWGDAPLRHQFYHGLPTRIKDEIARVGKPDTLAELKTLAQSIDARYWSRRQEQDRENKAVHHSAEYNSGKSEMNPVEPPANKSGNSDNSEDSGNSDQPSGSVNQSNTSEPPTLGKNGKLTVEEHS